MISVAIIEFIQAHLQDDPKRLLLSAERYSDIDIRFAAQQIEARQQIRDKLPLWYARPELIFPPSVSCQQASSQETARYKGRFIREGERIIDGTGGLGVDSVAFAAKASKVTYIEQNELLCRMAEHNFKSLGWDNIEVLHGSSIEMLQCPTQHPQHPQHQAPQPSPQLPAADLLYLDPSRRGVNQKRLFALDDCEPNILKFKETLLGRAPRVLVKISPMADIRHTLRLLPETTEMHIVSVKNECKELLFLLERPAKRQLATGDVPIYATHIHANGKEECFSFTLSEEEAASPLFDFQLSIFNFQFSIFNSPLPQGYLYEPNASILKAGAFKLPAHRYGLQKLHPHTHLYWAPCLNDSFLGRIFHIKDVVDFNKRTINTLCKTIPQANIAVRNFCMEAQELQKRLKIKEGGSVYLFGVTLSNRGYALIVGAKESSPNRVSE